MVRQRLTLPATDSTKKVQAKAAATPKFALNKNNAVKGEDAQMAALKKMHPLHLYVADYPW